MNVRLPLVVCILISIASCSTKLDTNPCGDPPGPPTVPAFRIMDKQTGKDYFIEHPSTGTPTITYSCSPEKVIRVDQYGLSKNNTNYGYIISTDAIVAYQNTSNNCYKLLIHWANNQTDTLQYTYYFTQQPCFTKTDLSAIYFNDVKVNQVVDSMNTAISYYTVFK